MLCVSMHLPRRVCACSTLCSSCALCCAVCARGVWPGWWQSCAAATNLGQPKPCALIQGGGHHQRRQHELRQAAYRRRPRRLWLQGGGAAVRGGMRELARLSCGAPRDSARAHTHTHTNAQAMLSSSMPEKKGEFQNFVNILSGAGLARGSGGCVLLLRLLCVYDCVCVCYVHVHVHVHERVHKACTCVRR